MLQITVMEDKPLFTKESLEALTVPRQIDRLLIIIKPWEWIALVCMIALIIGIVLWTIFGVVPITVNGRGLYFNPQAILQVHSEVEGVVNEIFVNEGDTISQNTNLIQLSNPSFFWEGQKLESQIAQAKEDIQNAKQKYSDTLSVKLDLSSQILEIQKTKLNSIEEWLKNSSQDPQVFLQLKQSYYDVEIAIRDLKAAISLLQNDLTYPSYPSLVEKRTWELIDLQVELKKLQEKIANLFIASPDEATVLLIPTQIGDHVEPGTPIIWLQKGASDSSGNGSSLVYGFFSPNESERIKEGMLVHIQFLSLDPKYGKLIGEVKRILPYAGSEQGDVLQAIPSQQVRELLSKGASSVLVEIDPLQNPNTASGYEWTTDLGPPFQIKPGSMVTMSVTVEEKSAISYLIPKVEEFKK